MKSCKQMLRLFVQLVVANDTCFSPSSKKKTQKMETKDEHVSDLKKQKKV